MKKNLHSHKITFLVTGISFALLPMEYAEAMNTQIQTDSTLSGISAMAIDSQGSNQVYTLSEINGKTVGGNLFYSFSNFSIGATDAAWFNLNTPDLANVISRVTGGAESIIDGHLQMTNVGSAPSFFFINPAGVTFGAGASVDVPGSFYVSTASGLNMSDGSVYAAHEAQASTLSAAEPESFGFLGNESGSINLSGLETDNLELTFKPGTDVGLISNNIQIKNAMIGNADFSQAGLRMALIATGSEAMDIILGTPTDESTQGDLSIRNADLVASGNGLGRIDVRSNHFAAVNSTLFLGNFNNDLADGQEINVQAHSLVLDNSKLFATTNSTGSSGDIVVKTNSLELDNSSAITSFASENSSGNSGDVLVNTSILKMDHQSTISSGSRGNMAGNVTVQADSLIMNNLSQIFSLAASQTGDVIVTGNDLTLNGSIISNTISGSGSIGDITVSSDSLKLLNSSAIGAVINSLSPSDTSSGSIITINTKALLSNDSTIQNTIITEGAGTAGDIIINADYLLLSRSRDDKPGGIFSTVIGNNEGNSGSIIINSQEIEINNGFVSTNVFGASGQAGDISVNTEILIMNGGQIRADTSAAAQGGSISINAGQLVINSQGEISTETKGDGDAGNISIIMDSLEFNDGFISTITGGKGNAGSVNITAESLKINQSGNIFSKSVLEATGHGGDIIIIAPQIQLSGAISSDSLGEGDAGNIIITTDTLKISEIGKISAATIEESQDLREKKPHGTGGDITIKAKVVEIKEEGFVSVNTASTGDAGSIFVNADHVLLKDAGSIEASAVGENVTGNGGNITIDTKALVFNDGLISSTTQGKGKAGNIEINTHTLDLAGTGGIQAGSGGRSNDKASGDGGSISINAEVVEIENAYIVNETYGSGNAGQINVNADSIQLHENGFISASTFGSGRSGDIQITANTLSSRGIGSTDIDLRSNDLSGVFSGADSGSSGQIGSINIGAKEGGQLDIQLENSAYISIQNKAKVTDNNTATAIPIIDIDTTNLSLINSFITTQSSGNVDAGSINIHFTGQFFLDPSAISTEANQGNGGDITIAGGEIVYLLDSAITTSVTGQTGNGGDINISANSLIMDSGFIQANTAAVGASGGNVNIKVPVLVPSGGFLQTGGNTPFEFQPFSGINVIQAAAPDGVSGTIIAALPQLNLSGVLTNLVIESFDSSTLSQNMCAVEQGSSLYQSGRGGLRMRARDFLLLPVY